MTIQVLLSFLILGAVVGFLAEIRFFGTVIIYDYQKGLLYRNGAFVKTLGVGKHRYLKSRSKIEVVDTRKAMMTLPGQEILTKDNVNIKITLAGLYEVSDPVKAKHQSAHYLSELYNTAQLILRDLVGSVTIDELLEKKREIDAQLLAKAAEKSSALGITVTALAVKDIMLPANLKRAFAGILEAQKEAQRQLEKARGEQAVLRSLANSSGLYENNPMLLQARIVQELSAGNNSIVFNADDRLVTKEKAKA